MKGLNHEGKGRFSTSAFDLTTTTEIDSLSVSYDGIPYLQNVHYVMDAILGVDLEKGQYTLQDQTMQINALPLQINGSLHLLDEAWDTDLTFSAPGSDVRELWSLLPGAYTADYADLQSDGQFSLQGWLKGRYATESVPAFHLGASVDNGRIQYPDLPGQITDLNLDMTIDQPGTFLDELEINLPVFGLALDGQPVTGRLHVKDVLLDPFLDGQVKGDLDLSKLSRVYPLDDTEISGKIAADLEVVARLSSLEDQQLEETRITGEALVQNITYRTTDQPEIRILSGQLQANPQLVRIRDVDIKAGRSDLQIQADIQNILALLSAQHPLRGRIQMRSDRLDLDEWQSPEEPTPTTLPVSSQSTASQAEVPDFALDLDLAVGQLISQGETLTDLVLQGSADRDLWKVNRCAATYLEQPIALRGQLIGVLDWLQGQGLLQGDLTADIARLDLNRFTGEQEETDPASADAFSPVLIPEDIQITVQADIDELVYTDMTLRNTRAQATIANQTVQLQNCRTTGLGGELALDGSYATTNPEKPAFHLRYDLQNLDFQQVYKQVNTFQVLAPIGRYLTGRFSSNLVMDGILGDQMIPDLATLDAAGFLETFDAVVTGFSPLEGVAQKMQVKELETLTLSNSKNWFEIKDGQIELKDVQHQMGDIALTIGGTHGLNRSMDYHIKAAIPREKIGSTTLGAQANQGLAWLEKEAAQIGIPVEAGDIVHVLVRLGGTLQQPTYKIRFLGTGGDKGSLAESASETAGQVISKARDSLEREARKRMEEEKDALAKKGQAQLDTLRKKADQQIDSTLKKAEDEAKKKAEEVLGKELGKKIEEIGGDKAKQEAEKIKEKMKKWDPFGRNSDKEKKDDGQ